MTSNFIRLFLDFILSPMGLGVAVIGAVLVRNAIKHRVIAWLLLALCAFAASLGTYQDEFIKTPPPLVFPLQQLRDMGRPLTTVLVFALLLVGFWQQRDKRVPILQPIKWLIVVQVMIFLKTVLYGSPTFALLAALVFGAAVLMINVGPVSWLQDLDNFRLGVWSVAIVAVIFLLVNGYQAIFNLYPLTFVQNRFLGTTGNPQHAAVLLAGTIPCLIFLTEHAKQRWQRGGWAVVLVLVMGVLLWTGSRTGVFMGVFTIVFFYRQKLWQFLRLGIIVGLISGLIFITFVDRNSVIWETALNQVTGRIFVDPATNFLTANSRQTVWAAQWRGFQQNPVLGAPLGGDRLMGYGESSWLGTAAALGLAGLIPLLLFGLACLSMISQLVQLGHKAPRHFFAASVVIAGLISLLIGSFFEAYLLGNLTFPLFALLIYLALGQSLIAQGDLLERNNSNLLSLPTQKQPDMVQRRPTGVPGALTN